MPEINSVTITITQLPNGRASVTAELPTPRPGMRLQSAAHSLAIDALGWIGKQPSTDGITYNDPALQDSWINRVRQYLTQETSERFLTVTEICAACPPPGGTRHAYTCYAIAQVMSNLGWLRNKRMRSGQAVAGYVCPSNADLLACEALAHNLQDPDGFAYSVSPEVRNAARRATGAKGREGLAA